MRKHIHLVDCDSTQDVLKEQIKRDASEYLVSCNDQKNGRGRGQNTWSSFPDSLYFSFNIKPFSKSSWSALEISTLLCRFFSEKYSIHLMLKWPNDVFYQGKKVAGILIQQNEGNWICGVGLNLFMPPENEFSGVFPLPILNLDKQRWCQEIVHFIDSHRYQSQESLKSDWLQICSHLNQRVIITDEKETTTGTFIGLGEWGEALVEVDHQLKHIYNGQLRINPKSDD